MSNPRGSTVRQTPTATRPAVLPALPPARTPFERTLAEILDVRTGAANPWERWTTQRDLHDLGLLGGLVTSSMPTDMQALPVWIGRGRFQLVSITALATALQEHLTLTASADTARDLQRIRRSIAAIQPGLSAVQVRQAIQEALRQTTVQLRSEVQDQAGSGGSTAGITQELQALAAQVGMLQSQAGKALGSVVAIEASSATWTVNHGMGYRPQVTVTDATGNELLADVEHTSTTQLIVRHGRARTGMVLLR